jgi:hypothetical protein
MKLSSYLAALQNPMGERIRLSYKELRLRTKDAINAFQAAKQWPMPEYNEQEQPHFMFILTLPFSGSTAISQILNTSHQTALLEERGEGQWLIPGLREGDPWNPENPVNYASVKAVWLNRFQFINALTQNVEVVVEKSPPNVARFSSLRGLFHRCSAIANNRNPYAYCGSLSAENPSATWAAAISWVQRSGLLRSAIECYDIPYISYESFCSEPASIESILPLSNDIKSKINFEAQVRVKSYPSQPIMDQNSRQIALLSGDQIGIISQVLKSHRDLVNFFGYGLIS